MYNCLRRICSRFGIQKRLLSKWAMKSQVAEAVATADVKIRPHVRQTPLERSLYLSKAIGGEVLLKMENEQTTGSFKFRGAVNKIISLTPQEQKRGVVTASTGNHALACLEAVRCCAPSLDLTIFLPTTATSAKVDALKAAGARLEFYGEDSERTEAKAREFADRNGRVFISPYNDPLILAGQGTIATELERQTDFRIDAVLVTVGGGGLISGIGAYIKAVRPDIKVIGVQPEINDCMYESLRAGRILEAGKFRDENTLSDGSAGGIEQGSITFDIVKRTTDEILLVREEQIAKAMYLLMDKHHRIVEGSAACTVAALLANEQKFRGKTVVCVLCGGNAPLSKLKQIISKYG